MWGFERVAIEKTVSPVNNDKGHGYHYTIANKITTANDCRRGSKIEVARFLNSTIKRFNTRHLTVTRPSIAL